MKSLTKKHLNHRLWTASHVYRMERGVLCCEQLRYISNISEAVHWIGNSSFVTSNALYFGPKISAFVVETGSGDALADDRILIFLIAYSAWYAARVRLMASATAPCLGRSLSSHIRCQKIDLPLAGPTCSNQPGTRPLEWQAQFDGIVASAATMHAAVRSLVYLVTAWNCQLRCMAKAKVLM
jgi:hypothetical protein